jgi:hypothetical protein
MNIRTIKRTIKNFFLKFNILLTKTTQEADLKKLIKLLKPKTTNFKLIRVGGDSDGGYLIPDDLKGIKSLFSPGVSNVSSFEEDLIKKIRNLRIFLADFSIKNIPFKYKLLNFEKKFIGSRSYKKSITLTDWVLKNETIQKESILQMDIEGSEFEVLINTNKDILNKFRIIIIEFHSLHKLIEEASFVFYKAAFEKILETHDVVHIHPNNTANPLFVKFKGITIPSVMEFTFLRKDRIKIKSKIKSFPHHLDMPCTKKRKDFILPNMWYK